MTGLAFAFIFLGLTLGAALGGCYAHTPVPPGQPNPADIPPITDQTKPDAGAR